MEKQTIYLIVNFGGPRDLSEVEEFIVCLFRDQEVLRTVLPSFVHNFIFTRLAKQRAQKVIPDYRHIGNKSPIYEDTEAVAQKVSALIGAPVYTFHRYLPRTHALFIEKMKMLPSTVEVRVFPMFPQFSYATTGSIARWFFLRLGEKINKQMQWVKSYPNNVYYIDAFEKNIKRFLNLHSLKEDKTILIFSAHGVPKKFIDTGDVYEEECRQSFLLLSQRFSKGRSCLCYQSQFGKKEWIRPYTADVCRTLSFWGKEYDNAVFVPLSFTSDHIETLFEVEEQYIPPLIAQGFRSYRCPALNQNEEWLNAIVKMLREEKTVPTKALLRR